MGSKKQISRLGFKSVGLNEMFKECEIIYVLAAITTENKNLIDKKLINKMRQNSILVLMSRAAIVNFKDLVKRLKRGDIYVATDVFPNEPVQKKDPIRKLKKYFIFSSQSWSFKNSVL